MLIFRCESGKRGWKEISIKSRDELKAWLKDKPVEWARAIAHRAAMRVLPLVAEEWKTGTSLERMQALTLAVLRANFISRVAGRLFMGDMNSFLIAASAAFSGAADAAAATKASRSAVTAASRAAIAASHFDRSGAFNAAASAASRSAFGKELATAAVWNAIATDATWLAGKPYRHASQHTFELLGEPLWHGAAPEWALMAFDELSDIGDYTGYADRPRDKSGWEHWTNWYAAVSGIGGSRPRDYFSRKLEQKIATQPDQWWKRRASAVNSDIARWVEEEKGAKRSIGDLVIELLTERGQPVHLQEIFNAASDAGLQVKEKSIRDSLSRLVSAGRIERVGLGLYQAAKADNSPAQNLEQRPAAHSFSEQNGKIHATALASSAQTNSFSEDVWAETERKARQTLERLKRTQAPDSVLETVESLLKTLGGGFGDVRPGLLLMQGRSIEALVAAYGAEGARAEMSEEAIQRVFDLYASVEDLKAFFPEIVKLEAERLAQRLASEDYAKARAAAKEIRDFAFMSEIVDDTAREALDLPERIIAQLDATISAVTDAKVVALTYEKRSQIGAQGLLDTGNFVIATIKAGTKAVASRAGKGALDGLEDGTKKVVSGAVVTGAVLLAMQILGPVAALGLFVSTFSSYKNKLEELVKKAEEVKPDVADVPPT